MYRLVCLLLWMRFVTKAASSDYEEMVPSKSGSSKSICSFPLQYLFIQLNYYSYFIWNKYIQLCWCVYLSLLTPSDSVDYGVYVGRNLRSWFCAVCLSYMDQLAYLLDLDMVDHILSVGIIYYMLCWNLCEKLIEKELMLKK